MFVKSGSINVKPRPKWPSAYSTHYRCIYFTSENVCNYQGEPHVAWPPDRVPTFQNMSPCGKVSRFYWGTIFTSMSSFIEVMLELLAKLSCTQRDRQTDEHIQPKRCCWTTTTLSSLVLFTAV